MPHAVQAMREQRLTADRDLGQEQDDVAGDQQASAAGDRLASGRDRSRAALDRLEASTDRQIASGWRTRKRITFDQNRAAGSCRRQQAVTTYAWSRVCAAEAVRLRVVVPPSRVFPGQPSGHHGHGGPVQVCLAVLGFAFVLFRCRRSRSRRGHLKGQGPTEEGPDRG
ncbi:hypothetical protein [Nonomuraea sp. C10]|uniref:hypothetical protein n=1 Tax=Nonomuraea sp. C10 TaxID=2600577 RepID=UPI0011DBCEAD|nr:hypothetical protein [Nonomuraea sp. C10]TXK39997.1 hypothetical protein FR742_10720 [Nonomuraea sp. C10]